MLKSLKTRWNETADMIVSNARQAATPEEALAILGSAIRKFRTAKGRADVISKRLVETAISLMDNHNLDELRVTRRTFLRLERTYKIPAGDKGQAIIESLVDKFGQGFVDSLYTKEEVVIPKTNSVTFTLDEEALGSLDVGVKRELGRKIGLTPKLAAVDVPQRAKEGRPRKRR